MKSQHKNNEGSENKWEILSGQRNWSGLLEPLNNDLRRYIIHYGEMAQVTYDAFDSDTGGCKYEINDIFCKVGVEKGKPFPYVVTKYIYATSSIKAPDDCTVASLSREGWYKESNWMGFIAVATDEGKNELGRRDIVIAWRGTKRLMEWVNNFQCVPVLAEEIFGESDDCDPLKVHLGWKSIYIWNDPFTETSAREQVLTEVRRLVELYHHDEMSITVTGHSLGAALATLNASDIAYNRYNTPKNMPERPCPVTAFVFASPLLGNKAYCNIFSNIPNLRLLRIKNKYDLVTKVPRLMYSHVGEELEIYAMRSDYLKLRQPSFLSNIHHLETYLHGVAGYQGRNNEFRLEINRDYALLNKHKDLLRDEYCIPASWWRLENKGGMEQQSDGSWKLVESEPKI